MLITLVIISIAVACGSFVGGILSSGVVVAFLKSAEAEAKAEEAKLKAVEKAVVAEIKHVL